MGWDEMGKRNPAIPRGEGEGRGGDVEGSRISGRCELCMYEVRVL
tara:strand:+ start:467 stop:601 length:135 start_codon:yes stop_codon:yes gene_type:complete